MGNPTPKTHNVARARRASRVFSHWSAALSLGSPLTGGYQQQDSTSSCTQKSAVSPSPLQAPSNPPTPTPLPHYPSLCHQQWTDSAARSMPQPSALSIVFAAVVAAPPVYKWHQPGSHCVGSARRGGAWTLGDEGPVSSLQSDASSDRQGGSDSSASWHCQHAARVGGSQGHEVHVTVSS